MTAAVAAQPAAVDSTGLGADAIVDTIAARYFPLPVRNSGRHSGRARHAVALAAVASAHLGVLLLIGHADAPAEAPSPRPLSVRMIEAATPVPPAVVPPKPLPLRPPKPVRPRTVVPPPLLTAAPAANADPVPAFVVPPPVAPAIPAEVAVAPAPPAVPIVAARYDADYLSNPAPVYPPLSRRFGEAGRVVLHVRVSADGLPLSVEIRRSSGFDRLDEAALRAVGRWRFVPARRGDAAVESSVLVPLTFTLRN